MGIVPILFLGDTHFGYNLPFRPRVQGRRKKPEFYAHFQMQAQRARIFSRELSTKGERQA